MTFNIILIVIKKVHQIAFSSTSPSEVKLTDYLLQATSLVSQSFTNYEYKIWTLNEAEEFIDHHFHKSVLCGFRSLKPFAYKADLFKYCVLFIEGGWYFDLGIRLLDQKAFSKIIDIDNLFFRASAGWDPTWNVALSIIYSYPLQEFYLSTINDVLDICINTNKGINPLDVTMSSFGRNIAKYNIQGDRVIVGNILDQANSAHKRVYHLKDYGKVAARKPGHGAGQLGIHGLSGANNYVRMWKNDNIFDKNYIKKISKPYFFNLNKLVKNL